MTVQVWDCLHEYAGILERGGTSGGEPRVLTRHTVRYAFVCDPTATTSRSASARR